MWQRMQIRYLWHHTLACRFGLDFFQYSFIQLRIRNYAMISFIKSCLFQGKHQWFISKKNAPEFLIFECHDAFSIALKVSVELSA